jgi:hypothetical protein
MASERKSSSATTTVSNPTTSAASSDLLTGRRQGRKPTHTATPIPTLRQIQKECIFNMHYHAGREAYLDASHRWLMFLVIVFGTSAVVDIFPSLPWVKVALSAAAAVMGALDLTFDLSGRARNHAVMKRRYSDVLTSCLRNADELAVARSSLMELAGEEEPAYHALIALSHNMAESQVYGDDDEHLHVPWHHKKLKNIVRFEGANYSLKSQSE